MLQKIDKIESIKFYYYGVVINGETYKYGYYSQPTEEGIEITSSEYYSDRVPSDIFAPYLEYNMGLYSINVSKEHPFYEFVFENYRKNKIRCLKLENKRLENRIKKLEKYNSQGKYDNSIAEKKAEIVQNSNLIDEISKVCAAEKCGQPVSKDIENFYEWREKVIADHKEELRLKDEAEAKARKEAFEKEKKITSDFLDTAMNSYPLNKADGKPYVMINWSECPAFYRWDDDQLEISLQAAEQALFQIDEYYYNDEMRGYSKTAFTIHYNGDEYVGRYDLGDGECGLINHIRNHGKWLIEDKVYGDEKRGKEVIEFSDYLQSCITD